MRCKESEPDSKTFIKDLEASETDGLPNLMIVKNKKCRINCHLRIGTNTYNAYCVLETSLSLFY